VRVLRLSRLHPRVSSPGSGLVAYKLSEYLPFATLYLSKVLDSPPLPFPSHVSPVFIDYPEPNFPDSLGVSKLRLFFVLAGKAIGNCLLLAKAARSIHSFKPDIVHTHTLIMLIPALWSKILLRCPLVVTFHGTDYYRFRRSCILRELVKRYVDSVICIAPDMFKDFKSLLPGIPASYIPNGVDLHLFKPGASESRRKQIVSVGRIFWPKGYFDLLEAIVEVFQTESDYRWVIVGSGPLEEKLKESVAQAGIAERVDFLGTLSQEQVAEELRQSELFVIASITEGFPKALIEAMACGMPVVATDVGACGVVVGGAGLIVPPGEPGELANAISTMLRSPSRRHRCSEQAMELAKQYSWEARAQKVRAIYENLLIPTESGI
jgi:glycosyltransferase involved in cell wall biosynthesis